MSDVSLPNGSNRVNRDPESYSDWLVGIGRSCAVNVPVAVLVPGFQLRGAGTDPRHVEILAKVARSSPLPPILVQKNGMRVIDGLHRCAAARLRGEVTVSAHVIECTDAEALIFAIKANTMHGLPLSRADRMASAELTLARYPGWSDRAIAELAGLSAKTVAGIRKNLAAGSPAGKRLGRDGRWRPLRSDDGRERAARYIAAHPQAPLRQVAREVGVSLGTAHSVRDRMRRGDTRSAAGQGPPVPVPAMPLTWSSLSLKLESDPALRYTEQGRAFLRWMAYHAVQESEWSKFVDAIPSHWRLDVSHVAMAVGREWRQFANRLRDGGTPNGRRTE